MWRVGAKRRLTNCFHRAYSHAELQEMGSSDEVYMVYGDTVLSFLGILCINCGVVLRLSYTGYASLYRASYSRVSFGTNFSRAQVHCVCRALGDISRPRPTWKCER
jgi:hypothetical protein